MTMYIPQYRRLSSIRETMDRLMDEAMVQNSTQEREFVLAVDVIAEDEVFTIRTFVPGLSAEEMDIEILNNTVSIHGEFKNETGENTKFLISELPQGRFGRTITLPVALDPTKAEANLKDGVLILRIPKAESYRPRTIKIVSQN